ncbi:MAG: Hdr-like menaquinol oxidoreductase iron-sulfur subunit 1 precursor [Candidatus Bathyarchaeota archaeon BA1]|nr:MAG: Hdr-like menaquinol oxidoreductase iron-sulfur subunit 1 precursor [Candidatus Bathyarchaeota archaeon BA1]
MYAENCCGCRICELICAYRHFQQNNAKKAAIRVFQLFPTPASNVPVVCHQCAIPKCAEKCPEQALYKAEDGRILLHVERCTGCRACLDACPFSAIYFHNDITTPIKCDLCDGDPACVKWCPTKALHCTPLSVIGQKRRVKLAYAMGGKP